MWIRIYMVSVYMLICSVIFTKPCKYFQLNSPYFCRRRGIFSKLDLDQQIPKKWRLHQCYVAHDTAPSHYPVFMKPEWGQNASGIVRIDNAQMLENWRQQHRQCAIAYIMQQGAAHAYEFEIFYIKDAHDNSQFAILTISESRNENGHYPINSINNPDTHYVDIIASFSETQQQQLWQHIQQIGDFKIARVSVKTDSKSALLAGEFKVVEVNIFIPMPINLLDASLSTWQIIKSATKYMFALAKVTKSRDKSLIEKPVFTKIMLYNRQSRFLQYLNQKNENCARNCI